MWNSKLDVYRTEWLDLVFANRNKSYGAYELRQHNSRTTLKALLTASGLVIGSIMVLFVFSRVHKTLPPVIQSPVLEKIVSLSRVIQPKTRENKSLKTTKLLARPAVQINAKKLVNLNVVPANAVTEEPVSIAELQTSEIASENTAGTSGSSLQAESSGNGYSGNPGVSSGQEIVATEFLEKYPEFPGGEAAFAKFLRKNLRYPYLAVESNITGRVLVGFIIEKNGTLSDIKVIRGIGGGCDEEAVRVLKKAPAWSPGLQNGRAVRVAYTMPIFFHLGN